jgi:hypothetical protein
MEWSTTDVVIFAIAAYLAVMALVRLMRNRRDELISQVRSRMQTEQRRKSSGGQERPREDAA